VKYLLFFIKAIIVLLFVTGAFFLGRNYKENNIVEKIVQTASPKPFLVYTIEHLSKTKYTPSPIALTERLFENEDYVSYLFNHYFQPNPDSSETKNVSGQVNIPNSEGPFPIILMARGYVDQEIYETGVGTRNAAAYFAQNGYITVAPDFLGYGDSSEEAGNIFETRFQTYTTLLSVLASLETIKEWDGKNIFFWAHSNGGQVVLTVLTITSQNYPTTLWAPVTKPFPYSVLYYTDESADTGKYIREELAKFESLYDTDKYSFTNYLESINAPIQIHQGNADDAVPVAWSDSIVNKLKNINKDVVYFKYPGADHNLRPAWDNVVRQDVEFFASHIIDN